MDIEYFILNMFEDKQKDDSDSIKLYNEAYTLEKDLIETLNNNERQKLNECLDKYFDYISSLEIELITFTLKFIKQIFE